MRCMCVSVCVCVLILIIIIFEFLFEGGGYKGDGQKDWEMSGTGMCDVKSPKNQNKNYANK